MNDDSAIELTASHWKTVEDIFHQALDLPAEARDRFVHEQSSGDPLIEREVREILDGYETQQEFTGRLGAEPQSAARYGAFEVVRKIGEGGMGVVYLARRSTDFEQFAAVKVINATPAYAAVLAERFRQERRILASLEHPNIARLLDGGVNSAGQSYLAMEYIEGERLDRYCAGRALSVDQILTLFQKICSAVQFAHQRLVIHRDLKPGNILVTRAGEPKLLDFGIAKVLTDHDGAPAGAVETALTMTNQPLLTPQYASPEQVRGLPCTVASDIYSLGVILYELLAGRAPYSVESATPGDWIAAVVTQEIDRPSVAAPNPLRPVLRGDIDGIVMKALSKRPEDRYASAAQLAEDIGRHRAGLPVTAVEGTRWYVGRKFLKRHRGAAIAAVAILFTLIGGLVATLREARVAERQRAQAEQRFNDARKLANYLLFPLYDSVRSLDGSLPVRADMAEQSLAYLDRLAAAKSDDPALHLELAEGYLRLGTILESPSGFGESLGNHVQALESDQKAVALLDPLDRSRPGDARIEQDLARAYLNLGPSLNASSRFDEALETMTRATAMFDRLSSTNPRDTALQDDAGRAYLALMDVVSSKGGGIIEPAAKSQVLDAASKAIDHFNAALAQSPGDAGALAGIARVDNTKASVFLASGDVDQAIQIYQQGLASIQSLPGPARMVPDNQGSEARLETGLGNCFGEMGRYRESFAVLDAAQVILDRLAAADPKNSTAAFRRMNLYRARAAIDENAGRVAQAIADDRETIAILNDLVAADPSKKSNALIRAETEQKIARLLAQQGHLDEANRFARAGIDFLDRIAEQADAPAQYLDEAAGAHLDPALAAFADDARVLKYAKRADELAGGKDPIAVFYLAQAYENLKDGPKALAAIERLGALIPPPAAGEPPSHRRQLYEKHLHRIEFFLKNGHYPSPDEN